MERSGNTPGMTTHQGAEWGCRMQEEVVGARCGEARGSPQWLRPTVLLSYIFGRLPKQSQLATATRWQRGFWQPPVPWPLFSAAGLEPLTATSSQAPARGSSALLLQRPRPRVMGTDTTAGPPNEQFSNWKGCAIFKSTGNSLNKHTQQKQSMWRYSWATCSKTDHP